MARHFTQTLTKLSSSSPNPSLNLKPSSSFFSLSSQFPYLRSFSNKSQLIEVDLDSGDGAGAGPEMEVMGMKRLEDAIHSIIVRRLAPDWLPFRPGSSYWVPPKRRADNILEMVGKLTNPLSDEEALSISSAHGWPCSSFFLEGSVSEHPIPVDVEVQVEVQNSTEKPLSEDEE